MKAGSRTLSVGLCNRPGCRIAAGAASLVNPSGRTSRRWGLVVRFMLRSALPQVRSIAPSASRPSRRDGALISLRSKLPGNPAQDCSQLLKSLLGRGLRHAQQPRSNDAREVVKVSRSSVNVSRNLGN